MTTLSYYHMLVPPHCITLVLSHSHTIYLSYALVVIQGLAQGIILIIVVELDTTDVIVSSKRKGEGLIPSPSADHFIFRTFDNGASTLVLM
jgi:hypothetical protein